jgi:hypothetical protein
MQVALVSIILLEDHPFLYSERYIMMGKFIKTL